VDDYGRGTNGEQFFIVHNPNGTPHLNGNHTVFGQVVSGLDVLEAVAAVTTGANDKPVNDVVMESVRIGTYSAT
jgi:cyclophilin family peptidyl-prolyl cis-trans isomerase